MLRHIANLGLLFSFVTLAVTGVMSFVLPFSITTARAHIVFGLVTIILVGLHLATRLRYFTRIAKQSVQIKDKSKPQVPRWLVAGIVVVWAGLVAAAFYGTQPTTGLVDLGYEARRTAEILRTSPRIAYEHFEDQTRVVQLKPKEKAVLVEVQIDYNDQLTQRPAAAVWAQTTRGAMIQTLFLDEQLAYSETPNFGGKPARRVDILPVWRHCYTMVNGIDPNGEIDALTGATPKHNFSLSETLKSEADKVQIFLELNLPGDTDERWTDPQMGQPSVLYAALIDLTTDQRYYLMQPVGHGGGAADNGGMGYDLNELSSARHLVDKVLVEINLDKQP